MTSNTVSQFPQLSESSIDKLNSLVRFTRDLRSDTSHPGDRIQRGSPRARFLGSLIPRKSGELQRLSLDQIFEEDGDFPGVNILHAHFAVFKETMERRFNDGGYDAGYSERVFYLEQLMYDNGIIRGHAELILEQNAYWKAKIAGTLHQPLARRLDYSNTSECQQAQPLPLFTSNVVSRHPPPVTVNQITSSFPLFGSREIESQPSQQPVPRPAPASIVPTLSQQPVPRPAPAAIIRTVSTFFPQPVPLPRRPAVDVTLPDQTREAMVTALPQAETGSHSDTEEPVTVNVDQLNYVYNRIVSLWKDSKHTDVTFLVGEGRERVSAHRAILASQSDFFDSLLFGEMTEAKKDEIDLQDIPRPELFVLLVNYVYTGKLEITNGNVQDVLDVLALADRFGFVQLKDALSEKLASMVTIDNILNLLPYADLYQASSLLETCLDTVDKRAEDVLTLEDFVTLSPSTFQLIISRDTFFVPEVKIYDTVLCWKARNTVSDDDLREVLGCVRLSEVPARELFVKIEPSQLFKPAEITSALRVQLKPELKEMRPRGMKEVDKNLFETAKFASSGNVGYPMSAGPPTIIEGVVKLDAPRRTSISLCNRGAEPKPALPLGGQGLRLGDGLQSTNVPIQNGGSYGGSSTAGGLGGMQVVGGGGVQNTGSVLSAGSINATGQLGGGISLGNRGGGGLSAGSINATGQLVGGISLGNRGGGGFLRKPRPNLGSGFLELPSQPLNTKTVELKHVYLINTITLEPFSYTPTTAAANDQRVLPTIDTRTDQWPISYKIKIAKSKETWETLYDFSEMDCYFTQTLRFPTQAVKYIQFELTLCTKPLELKFVSCSFKANMKQFNFLDKGVIGSLYPCPVDGYQVTELPPGHVTIRQSDVTRTVVLHTPHSMTQLRFKVLGPEASVSGDVRVLVSRKWEFESFRKVGKVLSNEFGTELSVNFKEVVVSYVLIHISKIKKKCAKKNSPPTAVVLSSSLTTTSVDLSTNPTDQGALSFIIRGARKQPSVATLDSWSPVPRRSTLVETISPSPSHVLSLPPDAIQLSTGVDDNDVDNSSSYFIQELFCQVLSN